MNVQKQNGWPGGLWTLRKPRAVLLPAHCWTRASFVVRISCFGILLLPALDAPAQLFKPLNPNQHATEIENKSVPLGNVNLGTLSPESRTPGTASISGKNASVKDAKLSDVELRMAERLSDLSMKTLPRQNFSPKRASLPSPVQPQEQVGLTQSKAQIPKREIKPFTPEGEQELRRQLLGLPPPYGENTIQSLPPSSAK